MIEKDLILKLLIYNIFKVLAALKEPLAGWIDNLYGPIFVTYAWLLGVLHTTLLDENVLTHIVPVDYCANMILTAAWKTSLENVQRKQNVTDQFKLEDPIVYNFVSSEKNLVTWGQYITTLKTEVRVSPAEQMKWYPSLNPCNKYWTFGLVTFLYHIVPGYLMDMVLRLRGEKPKMVKMYNTIHRNIRKVAFFAITDWTFGTHNSDKLMQCMSSQDQKLFGFDMNGLNWNEYFKVLILGVRQFIAKEKPTEESFRKARKTMKQFHLYHRIAQTVICGSAAGAVILLLTIVLRS